VTRKRRRIYFLLAAMIAGGGATGLILAAFQDNVTYFYGPSDLRTQTKTVGIRLIRLGGLVSPGSVRHDASGAIQFTVGDGKAEIPVHYRGILPDLFREGQGIIAEGRITADGVFTATTILAKHDETYMPPEVADALKRAGTWRGELQDKSQNKSIGPKQ